MDFLENINESFDVRFEETGETGDQTLILYDMNNDTQYRFYPEDTKKIINFLNNMDFCVNQVKKSSMTLGLNESFDIRYSVVDAEILFMIEDLDNNETLTFYPEDIQKLKKFFSRLVSFGIIKL